MHEQDLNWRQRLETAKVASVIHVAMQDVDVSRIHFAAVYSYFDRNETQLFKLMGISISSMLAKGYAMPVVATGCDYKKPFGLDDIVTVTSRVKKVGSKSLRIEHVITDEQGELLAEAFTVHVSVKEAKNAPISVEELFRGMGF